MKMKVKKKNVHRNIQDKNVHRNMLDKNNNNDSAF